MFEYYGRKSSQALRIAQQIGVAAEPGGIPRQRLYRILYSRGCTWHDEEQSWLLPDEIQRRLDLAAEVADLLYRQVHSICLHESDLFYMQPSIHGIIAETLSGLGKIRPRCFYQWGRVKVTPYCRYHRYLRLPLPADAAAPVCVALRLSGHPVHCVSYRFPGKDLEI